MKNSLKKMEKKLQSLEALSVNNPQKKRIEIGSTLENHLLEQMQQTYNQLAENGNVDSNCGCSVPHGGENKVDLIILIDASGSMHQAANNISNVAERAIKAAEKDCKVDLRINWFWVDQSYNVEDPLSPLSNYPDIKFQKSHENYLRDIGYSGPFPQDTPPTVGEGANWEEGADAIKVLCEQYDWRKEACRAIFYISDTNLDSDGFDQDDQIATDNAIQSALQNSVSIFAHYTEPYETGGAADPGAVNTYTALCEQTGGRVHIGGKGTEKLYATMLKEVICSACGLCRSFPFPKVEPCIDVYWGDSKCDGIETNDTEILYISVCNCYTDLVFQDFSIGYISLVDHNGETIPSLPDGNPSIKVIPRGPICFGDIEPCTENKGNCKVREIIIQTIGAKSGDYQLVLGGIHYELSKQFLINKKFTLNLCKD